MELFLPSLLIALFAIIVVIVILPRFSPLFIVIIASILLAVGTYSHFSMFWNEYTQSTWQSALKLFAPGIIIAAILIYILFGIVTLFKGGSVPIPAMPTLDMPSANTATNPITAALNTVMNTAKNVANTVVDKPNTNGRANNGKPNGNNGNNRNTTNNSNSNNNSGPTRSYLATA